VSLNGRDSDYEFIRDALIRQALRHQREHLTLARRKPFNRTRDAPTAHHPFHN